MKGEATLYLPGHRNLLAGSSVPWFNTNTGRWYIYDRQGRQVKWARIVLGNKLCRPLADDEDAHHLNSAKDDDRHENLVALTKAEHTRTHLRENGCVRNQFGEWPATVSDPNSS